MEDVSLCNFIQIAAIGFPTCILHPNRWTVELSLPESGRLLKGAQTFDEKVTQL